MRIHKEGTKTIVGVFIVLLALHFIGRVWIQSGFFELAYGIAALAFFIFILSFFRRPNRKPVASPEGLLSPCDGKVVVIEEAEEPEFFRGKRIQVSIFMSPLNVHVNYYPVSGKVRYVKYHPGKHLVAWHPKSSTENERSTVVVSSGEQDVLIRQIAGTVARRIVCYAKVAEEAVAGDELGFIKFGSRVDLFLPLGSAIAVKLNEKVAGAQTVIAKFPE